MKTCIQIYLTVYFEVITIMASFLSVYSDFQVIVAQPHSLQILQSLNS